MPIQLRIADNDPYVYIEPVLSGSAAIGTDDLDSNKFKIVVTDAARDIYPGSSTASISIDPSTNGNMEFAPHGTGDTRFLNGDVDIVAGNLLMTNTTLSGTSGVIEFGGSRFIHNKGTNSTFVGEVAGNLSNTGTSNVVVGASSMPSITTGTTNIVVGVSSASSITNASSNIVIGSSSLGNTSSATGNVVVGHSALTLSSSADYNTAIGNGALGVLATGDSNIAIGTNAGNTYTGAESNNIAIGSVGVVADSGAIRIGTSGAQTTAFIQGVNGVSVSSPSGTVVINASGQLGTSSALPMTWSIITADQTAAVNNGYICNKASALLLALPATSAVGDIIEVTGINTALGWKVTQAASQQTFFLGANTTSGATGFIQSSSIRDSVKLVCIVANLTWQIVYASGNITLS